MPQEKDVPTCSGHLVDQGIIEPSQSQQAHHALRRVAMRAGFPNEGWIGRLGLMIYGEGIE